MRSADTYARYTVLVGDDFQAKYREIYGDPKPNSVWPGPEDRPGGAFSLHGLSHTGFGERVNHQFMVKMTLLIIGLFSVLLAAWDIILLICGILQKQFLASFDSLVIRGAFIVVIGFITLGSCALLGIGAGAVNLAMGVVWIVFGILRHSSQASHETREKLGA
jgi:hypothetical protein